MELKRRIPALAISGTVLAGAMLTGSTAIAAQDQPTYRVTITNLTPGQPLTPPVVVLHNGKTQIARPGAAASEGIQQLSENGNNTPLLEALAADPNVGGFAAGTHPIVSGGIPGAAEVPSFAVIEVSGDKKKSKYISIAAMLICTNDGFAGMLDGKLPKKIGQSAVFSATAWDAGTETNTEAFADLVPPCQPLVGISSDAEGVGMSDPALAENGIIAEHAGIIGGTDLDAEAHAINTPSALVVVERIS
ncbi:MAG: spondin domain-containing protein [Chloroflexota bacterium]